MIFDSHLSLVSGGKGGILGGDASMELYLVGFLVREMLEGVFL